MCERATHLALDSDVLGCKHGSVGGRLVTVGLDLHATCCCNVVCCVPCVAGSFDPSLPPFLFVLFEWSVVLCAIQTEHTLAKYTIHNPQCVSVSCEGVRGYDVCVCA